MASNGEESDEMDSLFEGMVLFNPIEIGNNKAHDLGHDSTLSTINDALVSSSSSASQPLDENLFSDLTLVTPLQTPEGVGLYSDSDPNSTVTYSDTTTTVTAAKEVPSVCRQISRKKKRAGLRIGYGRGETPQFSDDQPPLPLPDVVDSRYVELDDSQLDRDIVTSSPLPSESHSESESRDPVHPTTTAASENELPHTSFTLEDIDHAQGCVLDAHPTIVSSDALQNQSGENEVGENANEIEFSCSIEKKYERVRAQISEKLKCARELASSISAARKDSIRKRRKAADNVNLASLKHRELEKQLEDACEAEDFEMAERVSESLAAAEKEKAGFLNALRDAEAECDAIDSQMQDVLECQIAAEEESVSSLERFASEAANSADLVLKKAEVLSTKEMDEWFSSTEVLEVKKMELEIGSHLINEARLVLNDSIQHSIEDDKREKEFLCERKDELTNELDKLLALVKEKEKEIKENDTKIKAVEERISRVFSGFQDMQSSIDATYNNLQSVLTQMELESEALSMKKNKISDLLSEEEDREAKIRQLAKVSADEAKSYQEVVGLRKSLMSSILKSREDRVRLAKTEDKLSENVQMLRQEVSSARASLQEVSSTKSNIQQEIASSKQRIFFIEKRIPDLEAEKKVAAAARNFKEAARIAAEAKTLGSEKEDIQIKLGAAMLELGKLEEEMEDTISRLHETEGLILSKEKELALARYQRLLLVSGAATAERSSALELGDVEEANLLLAEAEAVNFEVQKLESIYDFKEEEFANLPKHYISLELVSNLGGKQLAELAASLHISAA